MTKAIIDNKDVILDLEYQNRNKKRTGGHVITLIGTEKKDDQKFIYIHDPLSPSPQLDVYKLLDNNKIEDYRYSKNAFIRLALADAYIKESPYKINISTEKINYKIYKYKEILSNKMQEETTIKIIILLVSMSLVGCIIMNSLYKYN